MDQSKVMLVEESFNIYKGIFEKIEKIYKMSEDYPIFKKDELDDILYNTEKYIRQAFYNISNAYGVETEEELAFIEKLKLYGDRHEVVPEDTELKSVNSYIPEYIVLAKEIDKHAETNYAKELFDDTLKILKNLMNVDGNTYADESSFTYAFLDKIEKYIKE